MKCVYCEEKIGSGEKPYISKQAAMEGTYHWKCFVEACRNRIPVGIGAIDLPHLGGDDDASTKDKSADMQEA